MLNRSEKEMKIGDVSRATSQIKTWIMISLHFKMEIFLEFLNKTTNFSFATKHKKRKLGEQFFYISNNKYWHLLLLIFSMHTRSMFLLIQFPFTHVSKRSTKLEKNPFFVILIKSYRKRERERRRRCLMFKRSRD